MMPEFCIPFNKPFYQEIELQYMRQALDLGHISGDGYFTKQCHRFLEDVLCIPKVLLTTSCTDALEMCALLLDLQPGDEIIVPSFTFVSSINAFVLHGARPVFVDVRPDTLNLDEELLESAISERTKAIILVHYAGVSCELDRIMAIAGKHQIPVIEDNAHGLFGKYRGKFLGTYGALATLSFHETKNFTCGEGGALLINDESLIERAEIIREKGTNRGRFFRGQVDKYTWVDVGSSFLPSDLLAAFLLAQLEARADIQERRHKIWDTYVRGLQDWARVNEVRLPIVPEACEQTYHMFYLLLPDLARRQALIKHLRNRGILSVFHYLPLHLSEMGRRFGGKEGDCPVTEDVSDRLLRLPFYTALTASDQACVLDAVCEFNGREAKQM